MFKYISKTRKYTEHKFAYKYLWEKTTFYCFILFFQFFLYISSLVVVLLCKKEKLIFPTYQPNILQTIIYEVEYRAIEEVCITLYHNFFFFRSGSWNSYTSWCFVCKHEEVWWENVENILNFMFDNNIWKLKWLCFQYVSKWFFLLKSSMTAFQWYGNYFRFVSKVIITIPW